MIGLDTNVLVRFIAQDDERQSARATKMIEALTAQTPGFVSVLVLAETLWVLEEVYGCSRIRLAEIVETLLETETLVVQSSGWVWQALAAFQKGKADFADHLIERLSAQANCTVVMTFDKVAARDAGMKLLTA